MHDCKMEFKEKLMGFFDLHGHSISYNSFMYGPDFKLGESKFRQARVIPRILDKLNFFFRW
jgi:hypothetical protein